MPLQPLCNNPPANSFSLTEVWFGLCAFAADFLGGFRDGSEIEKSDDVLAELMSRGDDEAFSELYERYFSKIYAFTIRRVGNQQVAEDLVANIFLKAFAKRNTFVLRPSFSAWIYRIATNTITDHYRTARINTSIDDEEKPFDPADHRENVVEGTDRKMLGEEIEKVLEKLSERERIAVTMKFYVEASYEEIAETLKCTPNNAGVILHRALSKCEKMAGERLYKML